MHGIQSLLRLVIGHPIGPRESPLEHLGKASPSVLTHTEYRCNVEKAGQYCISHLNPNRFLCFYSELNGRSWEETCR